MNNVSKSNSLRWQNTDFREKTSHNISVGLKRSQIFKGEKNPKFKYRIFMNGEVISRTELSNRLNLSFSYCDSLIKKSADGEIVPIFKSNNINVINVKKRSQTIEMIA